MTKVELYWQRKNAHQCTQCGGTDERTLEGKILCSECWRVKQSYSDYRGMHRRCKRCGKQDAFTLNGRSCCADCAEYKRAINNECYSKNKESISERRKARYEDRKSQSLCPRCGKPANGNGFQCVACGEKDKRRILAKYRDKQRKEGRNPGPLGADGYCGRCNKNQAVPGFRLCADCLPSAQKRGRELGFQNRGKSENWKKLNDLIFQN